MLSHKVISPLRGMPRSQVCIIRWTGKVLSDLPVSWLLAYYLKAK